MKNFDITPTFKKEAGIFLSLFRIVSISSGHFSLTYDDNWFSSLMFMFLNNRHHASYTRIFLSDLTPYSFNNNHPSGNSIPGLLIADWVTCDSLSPTFIKVAS